MPRDKFNLRKSAALAGRSAIALAVCIFAAILARAALDGLFDAKRHLDWHFAFAFSAVFGLVWFCISFLYRVVRLRAAAPAEEILNNVASHGDAFKTHLSGFVAMEYFALILNRTFVVFIAPDGLYGWKAEGIVSARNPSYFQGYAKMLDDLELMHDIPAVQSLAKLKGGFVVPRSEITSVDAIHKQKWGMAGIPHSGRILIRFASGGKREFILLGRTDGERIKKAILS